MIFYSVRLLYFIFFISDVISIEFNDSPVLQSSKPNDYKIQIVGIERNACYIRDVSNEAPEALSRHIDKIKTMKPFLYDIVRDKDNEAEFFHSSLKEVKSDEIRIEYKKIYGKNFEYVSSKSVVFYNCFLNFSNIIQIVAPRINIGNCLFIPSNLFVSIILKCPEEIDCLLRSIVITPCDIPLTTIEQSCSLIDMSSNLKAICNGTSTEDHTLHFEGWIDFTCYRSKKDAIKFSIDKNWLVKFNFRP